jgi:hypothetical protein
LKGKYKKKREHMSSPADPVQQPIKPKGHQEASANKSPDTKDKPLLPPKVVPPQKHEAGSCHCKPDATPLWKVVLECGAIFVGIIVAIIYYAQWLAMDKTMKIDQRAWVGVKQINGTVEPGKAFNPYAVATNYGKTPALEVTDYAVMAFEEKPIDDVADFIKKSKHNPKILDGGAIFPTANLNIGGYGETSPDVTAARILAIEGGRLYFYFFGEIHYKDIFGDWHGTHFCGLWLRDQNAFATTGGCSTYNDAN